MASGTPAPNEIDVTHAQQGFAAVDNGIKLCYYTNFHSISPSNTKPILLLLHGYPQSYESQPAVSLVARLTCVDLLCRQRYANQLILGHPD